jgi:hypothetical protein
MPKKFLGQALRSPVTGGLSSDSNVFRFAREDTPRYTGGQLKELFLGVELPEVSDRARGAATQRPVAEL